MAPGWRVFPFDDRVLRWSVKARSLCDQILTDPEMDHWFRHDRTWFVGVDALPNRPDGELNGVPLRGAWAYDGPWHRAQLSVVFSGYPGRDEAETDAAHRYRVTRFAAHLDGLLADGPDKRRYLREPHAFILGLPLDQAPKGASPLVVWEGSHEVMRRGFRDIYHGIDAEDWAETDVTKAYQALRKRVFETCRPVEISMCPGEAVWVHRLAIHGVAPWRAEAGGRRAVAYFRPLVKRVSDWLDLP